MLTDISETSQQPLQDQSMTVLIGLTFEEDHLLSELSPQAKIIVPKLGKELADLIQQVASPRITQNFYNPDLQLYLQDWFLQLFQSRDDGYLNSQITAERVDLHLLLTGIDMILAYGYEITLCSPNPIGAAKAFYKALALKIASEQLQTQSDTAEHLYEIMLLD